MPCHNFFFKLGFNTNCCRRVCMCNCNIDEIIVVPNTQLTNLNFFN